MIMTYRYFILLMTDVEVMLCAQERLTYQILLIICISNISHHPKKSEFGAHSGDVHVINGRTASIKILKTVETVENGQVVNRS